MAKYTMKLVIWEGDDAEEEDSLMFNERLLSSEVYDDVHQFGKYIVKNIEDTLVKWERQYGE